MVYSCWWLLMEEIPGRLDKIEGAKSVIQDQNILNMNTSTASTSQTPFLHCIYGWYPSDANHKFCQSCAGFTKQYLKCDILHANLFLAGSWTTNCHGVFRSNVHKTIVSKPLEVWLGLSVSSLNLTLLFSKKIKTSGEHLKFTLTPCIYCISFPTSFYDSYIIPTQIPYLTKKCSMFQSDFTLLLLILSRNVSPSQSAQTPGQKSSLPALAHCQEKFCFVSFLICINWWKRVYTLCDRLWCYECPHEKD